MTGATELYAKYWRFFSCNAGPNPDQDPWLVQVRNNGGSWVDLENSVATVAPWTEVLFDIKALFPTPGNIQFQFRGSDLIAESFVDAGIDDFTILGTTGVSDAPESNSPVVRFALGASTPNPTAGTARIGFQVPVSTKVDIRVFDVAGRAVTTLANGTYEAGLHSVEWDGRDTAGHAVASGVYFYRMSADGYISTRSLIINR
jgi:hypothetical protein